jgi:hypothetical protein
MVVSTTKKLAALLGQSLEVVSILEMVIVLLVLSLEDVGEVGSTPEKAAVNWPILEVEKRSMKMNIAERDMVKVVKASAPTVITEQTKITSLAGLATVSQELSQVTPTAAWTAVPRGILGLAPIRARAFLKQRIQKRTTVMPVIQRRLEQLNQDTILKVPRDQLERQVHLSAMLQASRHQLQMHLTSVRQ